jgi:hypothetical protein
MHGQQNIKYICTFVFTKIVRYICLILTKFVVSRPMVVKEHNIKFFENPSYDMEPC